ncbi:AzlD domain-containing protein [Oricola sp.]|uniref:AzlD domain-containing protein n=1 Tax=Oricola sp. TaxID=1979950 RepID=UPI0025D6C022|nr:AzlD domain-containing protein [Oricola sp.]MCI5076999.1 AzlD domain-containing protein [Oricola sp.]
MTFSGIDAWWWPYLFILIAGWFATDFWRYAGVLVGRRLNEGSQAFEFVRAVATALVAAVISRLILFPTGALAETGVVLRIVAAVLGFAAFKLAGQRVVVGVGVSLAALAAGMVLGF